MIGSLLTMTGFFSKCSKICPNYVGFILTLIGFVKNMTLFVLNKAIHIS